MKNTNHSLVQLENQTQVSKIQKSIIVAFERTSTEIFNIEFMANDIVAEFPTLKDDEIVKAIRQQNNFIMGLSLSIKNN